MPASKQEAPEYKPPQKPKPFKSLVPITAAYALEPYLLHTDRDVTAEDFKLDYENDFVVAVGRLRAKHISKYMELYGAALENDIYLLFHLFGYIELRRAVDTMEFAQVGSVEPVNSLERFSNMLKEYKVKEIFNDDGSVVYQTSFGIVRGSPTTLATRLAVFVLSCFGRIVGENGDSYDLEPVSREEIEDHLDYRALGMASDDGNTMLLDLFSRCGLYTPGVEAAKDDEAKNLPKKKKQST